MSVKIMSAVFENEELGPTERLIMLALADHADDEGRCYPSIARLCRRTGLKERAIQNNVKTLSQKGYLTVDYGGGRNNANLYIVRANPAPDAPRTKCAPASDDTKTPHLTTRNPAPDAPKPLRTIIEPSDVIPQASPVGILSTVVSPRMARSFVALRSKMKKPVNDIAAERLAKSLQKIADQGGDPEDALGLCQEKGWQSIKPEWYFKDIRNGQSSRQQPHSVAHAHPTDRAIAFAAGAVRTPSKDCF